VPPVFTDRVRDGKDVGAADPVVVDHVDPAVAAVFVSVVPGRFAWFKDNMSIAVAIVIASLVWILLLALLSQAISALVKWRVVASGALVGLFLIPSVFGVHQRSLRNAHRKPHQSDGADQKRDRGLFGTFDRLTEVRRISDFDGTLLREIVFTQPPLWASWTMLFLICVALSRNAFMESQSV
jgi:hypothetical protein